MPAIVPNRPARIPPYAWNSILVNPDPPRLGEVAKIVFPLRNPGPGELIVERIETKIACFGMGVTWQALDPIGPFTLPPSGDACIEATAEWMPDAPGHRCVRASIFTRGQPTPMVVGRNMHVVQANSEEGLWRVPFRLGNPEPKRAAILLSAGGDQALDALVHIAGRTLPAGAPIWLHPGEEAPAELLLRADPGPELDAIRTVEAWVNGKLIDGIHITVLRPAWLRSAPAEYATADEFTRDMELALA